MSHVFHPREQHYPPKGFEIEIKGRKFYINPHGGYGKQLEQVTTLMVQNGIDPATAKSMCYPHWCAGRPDLCKGPVVKAPVPASGIMATVSRAVQAVKSVVTPKRKSRGRGCGSCGGGRAV